MPLPSELKDREDRLKADETNWQAKKVQLERQIHKCNLTLDELIPRLENLNQLIVAKTTELDQVASKSRALTGDITLKQQQVGSLDGKIGSARSILVDLESVIEHKREQIDLGLTEYAAKRRRDYDTELKTSQESAANARTTLDSLHIQIGIKRDELDQVRQEHANERQTHQELIAAQERQLHKVMDEVSPIEAQILALTVEVTRLDRTRSTIIADTRKAKEQFDGFIVYERRARKILEAKDRELLDKEQELAVEDRHLRARKSYLPPL